MRNVLLRPTHLAITAILLVAGLAGVTAGAVMEADDAPDTWSMPAFEPGQRGSYTYAVYNASGTAPVLLAPPVTLFAFEAMARSPVLGADGHVALADGLRIQPWSNEVQGAERQSAPADATVYWHDDGDVVAIDGSIGVSEKGTVNGTLGLLRTDYANALDAGHRWMWDDDRMQYDGELSYAHLSDMAPCGVAVPFQGAALDVEGMVHRCQIPNVPELPYLPDGHVMTSGDAGARYWTIVGSLQETYGTVDDGHTLVFRHEMSEDRSFTMWLPDDRPVATRMMWEEDGMQFVVTLTEWSTKAPRAADLEVQGDVALPALVAMRNGRPDDRAFGAAFPLDDAWAQALSDGRVADFLDAHPEARAFSISYDGDSYWDFQYAANDGSAFGVQVHRQQDDPLLPFLPASEPTYEVDFYDVNAPGVALADYPSLAPDLVQMRATAAAAGIPEGTWGWSFYVQCDPFAYACERPGADMRVTSWVAGSRQDLDPETPGVVRTDYSDRNTLAFRPDGRLAAIFTNNMTSTSRASVVGSSGESEALTLAALPRTTGDPLPDLAITAGSIGILAAVLYFFSPLAKNGVAALFSRVRPEKALDHPTRNRVAEAIAASPGIHGHDIARTVGVHRSTVEHHLRKLVECGHVIEHRASGFACYYPKGTDRRVIAAAPVLKSETARGILRQVEATPGATAGDVARALGVTRSTVSHHVKRLQAAGVLRTERRGQSLGLWAVTGMVSVAGALVTAA